MTTSHERSLDELLACGTYQGMTDEEIDRLLEYKAEAMAKERETAQMLTEQRNSAAAAAKAAEARFTEAQAVFEAACHAAVNASVPKADPQTAELEGVLPHGEEE